MDTRPWKLIAAWLSVVSKPPLVVETAVANGMWVWNTQRADARARWAPRWIMNAVVSHSPSPSTTVPSPSTTSRSDAVSSDHSGP